MLSGAPVLTTSAKTNSPVGKYTITNSIGDLVATNYVVSLTNGLLTINPALLGVSANNTNRAYGATNPVFTVSYSGFVNGDGLNVLSGAPVLSTSARTNSPVGNYTITNTIGTLVATNYVVSLTNGLLTVNGAVLGVSANNTNRAYGATNPVFTVSYSGFVNGDRTERAERRASLDDECGDEQSRGQLRDYEQFGDAGGDELRGESDERVADDQSGGVDADGEQPGEGVRADVGVQWGRNLGRAGW